MKKTLSTPNRRKFLLGAGLGTAGVAAALATRKGLVQKQAGAEPEATTQDGYRASAHVLKYYKTTEV